MRLVSTPGHSAGHLSVVLRLRDREALLCGDAAYTEDTIENGTVPYVIEDEHRYRRSLREIQLYVEQTPDALVVPGHEVAVMRRLRYGPVKPSAKHGPSPHGLVSVPPTCAGSPTSAATTSGPCAGAEWGSLPSRGGTLPVGGAGVPLAPPSRSGPVSQ